MSTPIIVRMCHVRQLNYCSRGAREFFEKNNLDFSEFLEKGIDSELLLSLTGDDAMALALVEVARG